MRTSVIEAIKALSINPDTLVAVRLTQYEVVLDKILETFTTLGQRGKNNFWLWEHFRGQKAVYSAGDGNNLDALASLISDAKRVWFLTEEWEGNKGKGNYWGFEGSPASIVNVIRELHHFEYYIVAKDFSWLVCENHHNTLIGVGELMCKRIEGLQQGKK
ncbi:DUF6756 family protein [Deinococcus sp.]|uniref:DUF6756 family protein n=1 Tax=Deinococcus sp. TaxID=47478 RepID=UPI002869E15B|nr:DUF6756 family protein [Deinococcus sp.]